MINGNDIIELGFKPGKWFKTAIEFANLNNLTGNNLLNYLNEVSPKYIEPLTEPINYHQNIRAESKEEQLNLENVILNMNEIMKTPTVVDGAIMPDACPTREFEIPVGAIVVTKNAIHPSMHSADICCSVMMTNLGMISPKLVLDAAHTVTHFGGGGRFEFSELPKDLTEQILENTFFKY